MQTVTQPPKTYQRIAYHAQYQGVYGQAIRDTQGRVWFLSDDDQVTRLYDTDIPALQMNGRVDIAASQRLEDGSVWDWIERRCTEHARGEVAA